MRVDRVMRFLPWVLGAAVFLLSGVTIDNGLPSFLGWDAPLTVLNGAAVVLAALSGVAAAYAHRYTWPVLVMAIAGWFLAGLWPAIFVASWCVGLRLRRAWAIVYLVAGVLLTSIPVYVAATRVPWPKFAAAYYAAAFNIVLVVLPVLLGRMYRTRTQMMKDLTFRALTAERNQKAREDNARADERVAIAREMHDIVAHRVALITLHAGAMQLSAPSPDTAKHAALIRTLGRQAMTELRQMLSVLRADGSASLTPQPSAADIDRLVGETKDAGLTAVLHRTGDPRPLPPAIELTVYRVIQEALTNIAKHAGTPPTTVNLHYGESQLDITVSNGPATGPSAEMPSGGLGLIGLSERITHMRGTLTTGPREDGGYTLHAALPLPPGEEEEC